MTDEQSKDDGNTFQTGPDIVTPCDTTMPLRPCPFCGSEAQIEKIGTARQSMIIACTNCGARVESGDVRGLTDPQAWAWNIRDKRELAAEREAREKVEDDLRMTESLNAITIDLLNDTVNELERRAEQAEAKLNIAREALEFVINRENLMFAECSDAEEIVTHCREALDKIK